LTARRPSLQKRFPGQTVARFKVWLPGSIIGVDGPIAPELARLIVAAWFSNKQDPKMLARFAALADEIQGATKKTKKLTDRDLRGKVSKARADGKIGRKA
jgi:hypothetical protein